MENVKLTFVNVGYGEAMVLECPAPKRPGGVFVMVIDGGSGEAEEYADRSGGRITLAEYLQAKGIDHIDCMVCTHIHEDHICGLVEAARLCPPAELWQTLPADFDLSNMRPLELSLAENASQRKFIQAINDYQILCALVRERGGVIRRLGAGDCGVLCPNVTCQALAPSVKQMQELQACFEGLMAEKDRKTFSKLLSALDGSLNNYSLILRLEICGLRVLLPGDTNGVGYGDISAEELRADLFKVGHHGQRDGADEALMDKVQPRAVVCCASSDRRYNSAHPDTLRMIARRGSRVYFSDCPPVPDGVDGAAPHQALEFAVDADGGLTAAYIAGV
ncbi:MAG: MBL fold metallo-hydrolase [Oscillibacter sp.]|nr:MBL fold metallo-hydrolase [Oscillibacter sp.]